MKPIECEEGSGNVYADLGHPDAEEMLEKSRIVTEIEHAIRARGLPSQVAAAVLRIKPTELADILRGQFSDIGVAQLAGYREALAAPTRPHVNRSPKLTRDMLRD